MKKICSIILCVLIFLPAYAGESGRASLKKGKSLLDSREFERAVSSLSEAEKDYPLLGDYALFWLSEAYHESGKHGEALNAARSLLKGYPESSLVRKARIAEITEAQETGEENLEKLFESYVSDYPRDAEMKYLFARWLKQQENEKKAKSLFKDLYIDAGAFSAQAFHELRPADLTVQERIRRAGNLIKFMEYAHAETALRTLLHEDAGGFRQEILRNLGLSLFKQKKYPEAADVYRKAGERYWEMRSRYRAGEKATVESSLEELAGSADSRMASILMAVASDRRREGKAGEAVRLFQDVMTKFPSEKEDALWGTGWTYFLAGEYQKATDVFTKLHETYKDPKYLYWKARSIEAAGGDASAMYPVVAPKERSFYGIMSYARIKNRTGQPDSGETGKIISRSGPVKVQSQNSRKIDRVDALLDMGFSDEALSEMIHISGNTGSLEDIIYICTKLLDMGEYKHSVRMAVKAPYMETLHHFLYPLAYWNTVEGLSEKYGIDPLLVLSVVREESRFDAEARSPAGALGLMQLMPQTAYRLNSSLKLGMTGPREIMNVKKNLHAGIFYLSRLVKEFDSYAYAIAAYNAGEEAVRRWRKTGNYTSTDEFIEDIPYGETRNYVKRVLATFFEYKRAYPESGGSLAIPVGKL